MSQEALLRKIQHELKACRLCPKVCGKPVHGPAVASRILLIGQAPGVHEEGRGRPWAHTAGKSLFRWFTDASGVDEDTFRERVYIAAAARCFPGKSASGKGDREPNAEELANCRKFLKAEVAVLKPDLIVVVGKIAIQEVLGPEFFPKGSSLASVVGKKIRVQFHGVEADVFALPHPSGVSSWPHMEPGKALLQKALRQVTRHPAWRRTFES